MGVQDEDSCGRSDLCETPQERMRRGGSRVTRGKRSLARKSTAVFQASISHTKRQAISGLSFYPYIGSAD
ncbi:hypothetical protein AAEO50_10135 [Rossellomorea oryzaecorticis]|uniref:Uncharacterized protein n=1 Tax=Rossellomorea oryzaecorticis TaxID=1396505 RepID=A0ABU9K978_9BACI